MLGDVLRNVEILTLREFSMRLQKLLEPLNRRPYRACVLAQARDSAILNYFLESVVSKLHRLVNYSF
ncbi:hypothetical protein HZH66_001209 [Vespula vulgaris]|uniref:Uncharacterized protein n=1 Tax=Vespula vulgaris TaxID=7454 RepID=A0A834KT08_VESVU|nr:hypothetical protein HZH66_001209 [Vespula vulgaris]